MHQYYFNTFLLPCMIEYILMLIDKDSDTENEMNILLDSKQSGHHGKFY